MAGQQGGSKRTWLTLNFRSPDFSEILKVRRKVTNFGLALSLFEVLCIAFSFSHRTCSSSMSSGRNFPDIISGFGSCYTLCTRALQKFKARLFLSLYEDLKSSWPQEIKLI